MKRYLALGDQQTVLLPPSGSPFMPDEIVVDIAPAIVHWIIVSSETISVVTTQPPILGRGIHEMLVPSRQEALQISHV